MNPLSVKIRVRKEAEYHFYSRLKGYIEHILNQITNRLNIRLSDQENQMNQRIDELEQMKIEAENGIVDIDAFKDNSAPIMETAECIINMLGME